MLTTITAALLGVMLVISSVAPAVAGPEPRLQQVIVVFNDSVAHPGTVGPEIDDLDGDLDDDPEVIADEMVAAYGGRVGFVYREGLKGFSATLPARAIAALQRNPRIAWVELDQEVHLYAQTVPTGIQRIFAVGNPNVTINGSDDLRIDVDVAVLDTGIDLNHPDLNVVASTNCSGGSPFKQRCGTGGDDDNGHGTHVAGTIGALDNGEGVVGVAPGARLWSVKVLDRHGSGYLSWIIAGIDYITANADKIEVANMSLGGTFESAAFDAAIAKSVAAGVAYAVAAGNSAEEADAHSPANHPDVLTVSALADFDGLPGGLGAPTCRVDQDDTLADFSNFGDLIEIAAPGVCIFSTLPGGYGTFSGTSMASPHAAGALALLASGANDPTSKADVDALYSTLTTNGNFNWTDDSDDEEQEPLLDVSNQTVFNPTTITGSGGGGGANTAPVADNVATNGDEDTVIAWVPSVSDADSDALSCSIVTTPANGSATVASDCTTGSYTPNPDFNGTDSFTYQASDGSATDNGTVSVTVNAVADAPVATNDSYSTAKDTVLTVDAPGVLGNDSDADGDTLSVTSSTKPSGGAVTVNADGSFTYTPAAGFIGTDSFDYVVSDGNLTAAATVTITVSNTVTLTTVSIEGVDGEVVVHDEETGTWEVVVTVTVIDAADDPVTGATVTGTWTGDASGTSSGITDAEGTVTLSTGILTTGSTVTFTVDDVTGTGLDYDAASSVTSTTVIKYD